MSGFTLFSILSSCLVYTVLLSLSESQSVENTSACERGESNFTKLTSVTGWAKMSRVKSRKTTEVPDCFVRIIAQLFFDSCKKRTVTKYSTEYYTEMKKSSIAVTECCPGYVKHENGTCIQGCQSGRYGQNCTENCTCPENAFESCEKFTGACICKEGWTGNNCTEACDSDHYGPNCEGQCSCENNSTCNIYSGFCNCTSPGWYGMSCDAECEDDNYGLNCEENCTCHVNQSCDSVTGNCTCKPGRTGLDCQDECPEGLYGIDCMYNCSCNVTNTDHCDVTSGKCVCRPGYSGSQCEYLCPFGSYGQECESSCTDKCNNTNYCDPIAGDCLCIGKKGIDCSEDCSEGTFGVNCNGVCSCGPSEVCGPIFGNCSCKQGYSGPSCVQELKSNSDAKQSGLSGNLPVILILGAAGGIVLIAIVIVFVCIKRRRRKAVETVKRETKPTNDSETEMEENLAYIPLEQRQNKEAVFVEQAYENANETGVNRINQTEESDTSPGAINNPNNVGAEDRLYGNVDANVSKNKNINDIYEEPDYQSGKQANNTDFLESQDVYDKTANRSASHPVNTYNTFAEFKQLNKQGDSSEENEYNVLNEIKKPILPSQEDYMTFQKVKEMDNDGSDGGETYNVLHAHGEHNREQLYTYGTTYHAAVDTENRTNLGTNKNTHPNGVDLKSDHNLVTREIGDNQELIEDQIDGTCEQNTTESTLTENNLTRTHEDVYENYDSGKGFQDDSVDVPYENRTFQEKPPGADVSISESDYYDFRN